MKASLSEFSMTELMGLAMRAKDKVVMLKMTEPSLSIFFEGGKPVFAVYRKLKGPEAFVAAMFVTEGEVEITPVTAECAIRRNLNVSFEELLARYNTEEAAFLEASAFVDSIDRTIEPMVILSRTQTFCIPNNQWSIMTSLLKGLSLREAALDAGTAEYMVIETVADFLRLGVISLGSYKEYSFGTADSVAEAGIIGESSSKPDLLDEDSRPTSTAHEQWVEKEFELAVTMFPIISDFVDNPEIDDDTIVINTDLFTLMAQQCGASFSRCLVGNLANESVNPVVMKVYVHNAVDQTAVSTGALFKLKVWSGSKISIKPLPD